MTDGPTVDVVQGHARRLCTDLGSQFVGSSREQQRARALPGDADHLSFLICDDAAIGYYQKITDRDTLTILIVYE